MSGIVGSVGSKSGIIGQTEIDYEEGTWTPVLAGTGGNSGQGYDAQKGEYTKIGNWVNCHWSLDLNTEGSFTGLITLGGFPFTYDGGGIGAGALGNGGVFYWQDTGDSLILMSLQMGPGTSAYIWSKTSASTNREYLGAAGLSGSTIMSGTFGYRTA